MSGRQLFSESEKVCLQELIIKYKLNSISTIGAGNPSVKRTAWARLTEEFNCIAENSTRTEAQLKKCYDNLKTRRKQVLALEKRERMKTGGGSYHPPSTSQSTQEPIDEALLDATDVELTYVVDSDTVTQGTPESEVMHYEVEELQIQVEPQTSSQVESHASETQPERVRNRISPHRGSGSRLSDYGANSSQTQGIKNVRAQVTTEEFNLRKENYRLTQEREEELHRLRLTEREWLVKAAEEQYHKARLERESAKELLRYNRAKREKAEIELNLIKQ